MGVAGQLAGKAGLRCQLVVEGQEAGVLGLVLEDVQQRGLAGAARIGVALLMLWIRCRSGFG